jgi:membrane-associated HD superfamily phosphohydrolase
LIEFNRQREKTPGQIVNEFEEILEIEKERGKQRMAEGGSKSEQGSSNLKNHDSWDNAAKTVGVSEGTLSKGKKVKDKATSDNEPKEVREAAQDAWNDLQSGDESFHGAYQNVKDAENKVKKERKKEKITDTVEQNESENTVSFDVRQGQWWALPRDMGEPHLIYCGDSASDTFISEVESSDVSFAFADPPYNADAAEWDKDFEWKHDYLSDIADVVAVTPGIESIKSFMCLTSMPYEWSVTAWIDNGMTRGALGFGNWIYIALFTNQESIHQQSQDIARVSVRTSESDETDHKGRKPTELMEWFTERFADGGVVIDPFLGSGTTLLTTHELSTSRVIGAEIKPEFCEQILERYTDLTDTQPEVIDEN